MGHGSIARISNHHQRSLSRQKVKVQNSDVRIHAIPGSDV